MSTIIQKFRILSLPAKVLVVLGVVAAVLGILARSYRLGFPDSQVFDEVYFPVFAANYLKGVSVFDVHPPLGKFIIAIGIAIFGDHPFGWRIMPALIGLLTIPLGWFLGKAYFKRRISGLLLMMFLSMETMLVVYSRTGLLDGIQFFFIFACLLLAVRIKKPSGLIGLAVLIGMAMSIKWVALGIVIPVGYIMWRKGMLTKFIGSLSISLAIYLFFVLAGQVRNGVANPWLGVAEWHNQAFEYHLHLTATHPWSSMWWSWPIMQRPVLFFYNTSIPDHIMVITALGNPILWWSGTVAVIFSLAFMVELGIRDWRKALDHPLVPLLLGYAAFYAPWIPIHRVVFLYHYLPSYGFALLMWVYFLTVGWKRYPWIVVLLAAAAVIVGIYFLTIAMGLPITQAELNHHLWLKSWL